MTGNADAMDCCQAILANFLSQHGYSYVATHSRPRGVALEFTKEDDAVFAACEGTVLYLDLILRLDDGRILRVSLNQVFWFNGVRTLVGPKSCVATAEEFVRVASEVPALEMLLSGRSEAIDRRYCFPMNEASLDQYLEHQIGT